LVPTKVINVAPKRSLGQKTKSSQNIWVWVKPRGRCVSLPMKKRSMKETCLGFRVCTSRGGWMLAYGHMGLIVNTENMATMKS